MNKPELLAPAGDMEKLKTALYFGADAVYLGGPGLHLRAASADFTLDDLQTGVEYAHGLGKRVYVTVNAFARNGDFETLPEYAQALSNMGVDAVLVADIGVLAAVKKAAPSLPVHISTQANCTNYAAANVYHDLGASRVVLARELSMEEIGELRSKIQPGLELEVFIHGAMCMAYSGLVSYTHLDVYKRQDDQIRIPFQNRQGQQQTGDELGADVPWNGIGSRRQPSLNQQIQVFPPPFLIADVLGPCDIPIHRHGALVKVPPADEPHRPILRQRQGYQEPQGRARLVAVNGNFPIAGPGLDASSVQNKGISLKGPFRSQGSKALEGGQDVVRRVDAGDAALPLREGGTEAQAMGHALAGRRRNGPG